MNLFELFVKIGVDDQASGKLSKLSSSLGKGLATAAKIGTAAVGAAAAGITALTTAAVNNYAEYEQLVGGVDTLFEHASQKVQQYAADAYKTAGMSANDYMANATAFSASLISSLGGDTEKAAEYANRAMVSMSDNANKMGTSLDSIVQTYQSLSRGNMAMLDNLKLGYGGTKAELKRLIKDAASYTDIQKEMGITVDKSSMSFDNIVNAIAVVQGKLGIAGATAAEAGTTIEGSVNSMKAAWSNLVTGFADKNADIEGLINNLVTTIVGDGTESNLGVIGNVLPAIERALGGIGTLIEGAVPKIVDILPGLVSKIAPSLISASTNLVKSLTIALPSLLQTIIDALIKNAPALIVASIAMVEQISKGVLSMLPDILQLGIDLMFVLLDGITNMIGDPAFVQTIVDVVLKIVDILTNPDTIVKLLNSAVTIIVSLAKGLIQALPQLIAKVPEIISNLVKAFGQFLQPVIDIGKNIIDGIKQGISNAWNGLVKWFKGLFGDLIGIAKKILGIASPSKVFKKLGSFTADGFGIGFEDEFAHVKDDMEDALNFDDASVGINASIRKVGAGAAGMAYGGSSFGDVYININGANYDDPQSLAVAVAEELQNMTDRRLAVYA